MREIGFSNRTAFDLFASPAESRVPTIASLIERWTVFTDPAVLTQPTTAVPAP